MLCCMPYTRFRTEEDADDEVLTLAVMKNGKKVVAGTQSGVLNIYSWGAMKDCSDRYDGKPCPSLPPYRLLCAMGCCHCLLCAMGCSFPLTSLMICYVMCFMNCLVHCYDHYVNAPVQHILSLCYCYYMVLTCLPLLSGSQVILSQWMQSSSLMKPRC
jgi:hypothetical protein